MQVIARKEIETPLGTLETGAEVSTDADMVRASCIIEDSFPKLTKCFGVDAIRRASWQIEILEDIPSLRLFLRWCPGYSWEWHFGGGAQHFEAKQYTAGDCTAHIGSYDDHHLLTRAILDGGSLPERFARHYDKLMDSLDVEEIADFEDIAWLQFSPEGLAVELPALCEGEIVSIVLTASWFTGKYGDGRGQTCFAADAALEGDVPWDER